MNSVRWLCVPSFQFLSKRWCWNYGRGQRTSSSDEPKTPIAIFAYKRPWHLRQLLDLMLQCERLDECQVHIFCDGVKVEGRKQCVCDT